MTEVKGMDLEMEELHMAASAYYNNASTEFKQLAREFFESMDTNQDDTVSIDEFVEFFKDCDNMDRNFFAALDRNGDGNLQFREALTVFYILIARRLLCDNCGKMILGLHFTCVQCFDRVNQQSYDLCVTCYSKGGFQHPHANFLDNFMLLGYMGRLPPPEDTNPTQVQQLDESPSVQALVARSGDARVRKRVKAFKALMTAVNIVSAVNGCPTM